MLQPESGLYVQGHVKIVDNQRIAMDEAQMWERAVYILSLPYTNKWFQLPVQVTKKGSGIGDFQVKEIQDAAKHHLDILETDAVLMCEATYTDAGEVAPDAREGEGWHDVQD